MRPPRLSQTRSRVRQGQRTPLGVWTHGSVRQRTETTLCNRGTRVASVQRVVVDDDNTQVGPAPQQSDTELASADTGEWDDTDREIIAQGERELVPAMFDDTG